VASIFFCAGGNLFGITNRCSPRGELLEWIEGEFDLEEFDAKTATIAMMKADRRYASLIQRSAGNEQL
jgi:hypothetical protein